jgi:L-fuconolactonase
LDSASALAPLRRSFLPPELAPQATSVGVTATVVVQTVTEPAETPELLTLAATEPLVAAVVGRTDLAAPTVANALGELAALPGGERLVGIRHPLLTESDPEWLERADIRRGLSALAAAGLTFVIFSVPAPAGEAGSGGDPDDSVAHLRPYLDLALDSFGPTLSVAAGASDRAVGRQT